MIQILKISIGLMVYFILAIEGNGQSSFAVLAAAKSHLGVSDILMNKKWFDRSRSRINQFIPVFSWYCDITICLITFVSNN